MKNVSSFVFVSLFFSKENKFSFILMSKNIAMTLIMLGTCIKITKMEAFEI